MSVVMAPRISGRDFAGAGDTDLQLHMDRLWDKAVRAAHWFGEDSREANVSLRIYLNVLHSVAAARAAEQARREAAAKRRKEEVARQLEEARRQGEAGPRWLSLGNRAA